MTKKEAQTILNIKKHLMTDGKHIFIQAALIQALNSFKHAILENDITFNQTDPKKVEL